MHFTLRVPGIVTALGALLLVACPTTEACPDGQLYYPDEGRCRVPDTDAPMPMDTGTDVAMGDASCAGACTAPQVCDFATGDCVDCVEDEDCSSTSRGEACISNVCEACRDDDQCTEVDASACNASNECEGCAADADCTHLTATPVCDEGTNTCVVCTVDTESTRCGANSCNPMTGTCTTTARMTVTTCGACVADSECLDANERCVPMNFDGAARTGGYCLRQLDAGCTRPFATPTVARASLSGATAEVYCGVNEDVTTCEAVRALIDSTPCTTDENCGAAGVDDGRCETVSGIANRCSYDCSISDHCPSGISCPAVADSYCGRT